MGGITLTIMADSLPNLMAKFLRDVESSGDDLMLKCPEDDLYLDGLTIKIKVQDQWFTFGDRGIEESAGTLGCYPIPKEKYVLFAHFHT